MDPADPDDVAGGLLAASGPDGARMGERGRRIAAELSWDLSARKHAASYRAALAAA